MLSFRNKEKVLHVILFAIAMLSIGSASILVRLSMASGIACAFWRLSISSILILVISCLSKQKFLGKFANDKPLSSKLFIAGFALAFHFILWMNSLFRISIAVSTTIVVAYPLHLALTEVLLKKEQVMTGSVVGLSIGFLGIILLFKEALVEEELDVVGILESFIASIFAAIYFYVGRVIRRKIDVYSYSFYVYSIASLTVLTYSMTIGENVFKYFQKSWMWFLLLALIPMFGGHTVMNYLLKFYRSSSVSSIALAEPVIASTLATLILGEVLEQDQIPYLAMVLTGVGFSLISELKSDRGGIR